MLGCLSVCVSVYSRLVGEGGVENWVDCRTEGQKLDQGLVTMIKISGPSRVSKCCEARWDRRRRMGNGNAKKPKTRGRGTRGKREDEKVCG